MDIAQYDNAVAAVLKSDEFILVIHHNAHLVEHQVRLAKYFLAMQNVLPKNVWSCPILAGTLLTRMESAGALMAGDILAGESRAWMNALGGDKR